MGQCSDGWWLWPNVPQAQRFSFSKSPSTSIEVSSIYSNNFGECNKTIKNTSMWTLFGGLDKKRRRKTRIIASFKLNTTNAELCATSKQLRSRSITALYFAAVFYVDHFNQIHLSAFYTNSKINTEYVRNSTVFLAPLNRDAAARRNLC